MAFLCPFHFHRTSFVEPFPAPAREHFVWKPGKSHLQENAIFFSFLFHVFQIAFLGKESGITNFLQLVKASLITMSSGHGITRQIRFTPELPNLNIIGVGACKWLCSQHKISHKYSFNYYIEQSSDMRKGEDQTNSKKRVLRDKFLCKTMGRMRLRSSGCHCLWQTLISPCLTSCSFLSKLAKQEQDKNLFGLVIMTLLMANTRVYHEQCRYRDSSNLSEISMQVLSAEPLQKLVFFYEYRHLSENKPFCFPAGPQRGWVQLGLFFFYYIQFSTLSSHAFRKIPEAPIQWVSFTDSQIVQPTNETL